MVSSGAYNSSGYLDKTYRRDTNPKPSTDGVSGLEGPSVTEEQLEVDSCWGRDVATGRFLCSSGRCTVITNRQH